jgi:alkaline phosphatase D
MQKFLLILLFCALISCGESKAQNPLNEALKPFYYGVASGDPLENSVIIWTRVSPEKEGTTVSVKWKMATDSAMRKIVQKGTSLTNAEKGYTVKIDVGGLQAGTTYYYQFEALGKKSLIGRTKIVPKGEVNHLRFAVVSCSNYQAGYFNAYGRIADRNDLDAVIHLGDYIYEYPDGGYGDSILIVSGARSISPKHELLSLEDYRSRYATYRLDPDLQRLHQMHPFITVWDDHETANDAYKDGAQNHNENGKEEGEWERRKKNARQAYAEWLPIRGAANKIYRSIPYGNLAELIMLDTRLEGRDKQISKISDPELYSEERTILGKEQREWLFNTLEKSKAKWKILGNQVMFADYNIGWAAAGNPQYTPEQLESIFLDIWDGYPAERNKIINFLTEKKINDVVIITGDVHCSFAYDIALRPSVFTEKGSMPNYNPTTGEGSVAVEFVTPSISSSNFDENLKSMTTAKMLAYQMNKPLPLPAPNNVNPNPHMKFANLTDHGYFILDLTPEKAQADWYFMKDILTKNTEEYYAEGWLTKAGENKLQKAEKPADSKK